MDSTIEIGQRPDGYSPFSPFENMRPEAVLPVVGLFVIAIVVSAVSWFAYKAYNERVRKIYLCAGENDFTVEISRFSRRIVTRSYDPGAIQLHLAGDHLHIKVLFDDHVTSMQNSLATPANLRQFARHSFV